MRSTTTITALACLLFATGCDHGSGASPPVSPQPRGWSGPYWLPLVGMDMAMSEIAHALLLAKPGPHQGKVLLIQTNGARWLWDPADPAKFVMEDAHGQTIENLFCSGHSADGNGDLVLVAGHRVVEPMAGTCGSQPTWSYLLDAASLAYSDNFPLLVPSPPPANLGYWYPGTVRLPDGRVLSAGGGSAPLQPQAPCFDPPGLYFVDGWQIFDADQGGWLGSGPNQWFAGLPTGADGHDYRFTYYPLLFTIPASPPASAANSRGFVFASVVPDFGGSGGLPGRSGTAILDASAPGWPATGAWTIHDSQLAQPGGVPRNLQYPSSVLRPLQLGADGLPTGPVEVMVIGGADWNLPVANPPAPGPGQDGGGTPAIATVAQISAPEQPGSQWRSGGERFPDLNFARTYGNAVLLPDWQLMVVGGSKYDFYPNAGGAPGVPGPQSERVAEPVMEPEFLDLLSPAPQWRIGAAPISPRLYHSVALLLPDGRVMVGGGYQGMSFLGLPSQPVHYTRVNFVHSDIEIWNPEYLSAGPRPGIAAVGGGGALGFDAPFSIDVTLDGVTAPNAAIGSVLLITPGTVTHHFGWDQRMVALSFSPEAGSRQRLVVRAPQNGSVAPPGWYMLFVVTDGAASGGVRIPSVARFVQLR